MLDLKSNILALLCLQVLIRFLLSFLVSFVDLVYLVLHSHGRFLKGLNSIFCSRIGDVLVTLLVSTKRHPSVLWRTGKKNSVRYSNLKQGTNFQN